MPTANSAQTTASSRKTTNEASSWLVLVLKILSAISRILPAPKRRMAAIRKSIAFQLTSVVNCMATSGMSKMPAIAPVISIGLLVVASMIPKGNTFLLHGNLNNCEGLQKYIKAQIVVDCDYLVVGPPIAVNTLSTGSHSSSLLPSSSIM